VGRLLALCLLGAHLSEPGTGRRGVADRSGAPRRGRTSQRELPRPGSLAMVVEHGACVSLLRNRDPGPAEPGIAGSRRKRCAAARRVSAPVRHRRGDQCAHAFSRSCTYRGGAMSSAGSTRQGLVGWASTSNVRQYPQRKLNAAVTALPDRAARDSIFPQRQLSWPQGRAATTSSSSRSRRAARFLATACANPLCRRIPPGAFLPGSAPAKTGDASRAGIMEPAEAAKR